MRAIDIGSPEIGQYSQIDKHSKQRNQGTAVDLGAYEY
ncbi:MULTISPECIES: choice-of-anchor Q domain-containing protein [Nostocales]|nr:MULTISPECIES: choice-of-anchor Q domain-containing protein [Nostocales]